MKIHIYEDELYPWYFLDSSLKTWSRAFDVPAGTVNRWLAIQKEWQQMQEEMKKYFEGAE